MNQTLYENGNILTMEDSPAQAVLVRDGRIAFAGDNRQARLLAGPDTHRVDLKGDTLMPAFIDAHSHFAGYAHSLLQVDLAGADSLAEMEERIRVFIEENALPAGEWVKAGGYDHNTLSPALHPAREWLDRVVPAHPVVLQHQSGHMGVFNTLALERLGVTVDTPDPSGGKIGREDGQLTGYMEENAFVEYLQRLPAPPAGALMDALDRAQQRYAAFGITTAQEGMLTSELAGLYAAYLDTGRLKLDVVGYMDMADNRHIKDILKRALNGYDRHFRIGGYKMFLDGSPQGRTAWLRQPYEGSSDSGYPVLADEQVEQRLRTALSESRQILAHCNGDAAAAQYLRAYERVQGEYPNSSIRPVMIHAQLVGQDQLPQLKKWGIIPSFFVAHVYYWGDVHIRNFGLQRASQISPAAAAGRQGIPYTFHQDAPVIQPDMLATVWCAVNRMTKAGVCLGADQRVGVMDALRAVTLNAAYQYGEEEEKGSIRAGKRADLVRLDRNPLTTPPERLREIRVVETMKDGHILFRA